MTAATNAGCSPHYHGDISGIGNPYYSFLARRPSMLHIDKTSGAIMHRENRNGRALAAANEAAPDSPMDGALPSGERGDALMSRIAEDWLGEIRPASSVVSEYLQAHGKDRAVSR